MIRTTGRFIAVFWGFALIASTVAAAIAAAPAEAARRKVIIDQDAFEGPGLQPLLMILQDPQVEVLGITIESGDGWQAEEVAATLRMLELIKRSDIPVVAGAIYPLVNSMATQKLREKLYGPVPYKGAWMEEWPKYNNMARRAWHPADVVPPMTEGMPTTRPIDETAANFMIRMTRQYPGEVSIVAMGPLTNIALAQRLDDGFAARTKELVTMGGGNLLGVDLDKPIDEFAMQVVHNPRQSFNFYWDPEAAHIVFTSAFPKISVVTDDATAPTRGTPELIARATASGKPVAAYVKRIAQPGFPLWDETQAAVWLRPGIVTRSNRLAVDVSTVPGPGYGGFLTWPEGKGPGLGERDVTIVYAIDIPQLNALFVDLIGR
jgi:purine nucleosidase